MDKPLAVYVHVPFCPSKCGYCDFNSYAMSGEIMDRTTRATIQEIERSPWAGRPAKTIFFGGGTPTFLPVEQMIALLDAVRRAHPPLPDAEITSEANPGTVDMPKFAAMAEAGFNRISLGAQSFVDGDLVRLGRVHRSGEIERAVAAAREAGFKNLNLDLMFALPGQSRRAWEANLDRALSLEPDHLSLYCLTLEPNTPFFKEHLRGTLTLPDEEEQVAMYDHCLERTRKAGLVHYEISNFARPGFESRHNLAYWRGEEYAGYGPGAVERVGMRRTTNWKHPERYIEAVESGRDLACEQDDLDEESLRLERIMLGLRLREGIPETWAAAAGIDKMVGRGWLSQEDGKIALTAQGLHFCSEVALELVG